MNKNLIKYTAYVWNNGSFKDRFKIMLDENITNKEAEEMLSYHQCHILRSDKNIIQNFKINGDWKTFIIDNKNTFNKQMVDLCNKLKTDIEIISISGNKHYYKFGVFGCMY